MEDSVFPQFYETKNQKNGRFVFFKQPTKKIPKLPKIRSSIFTIASRGSVRQHSQFFRHVVNPAAALQRTTQSFAPNICIYMIYTNTNNRIITA